MADLLLVSDVGSTTTKLLLLEVGGGEFKALGAVSVGTTVEKPSEDVCIGFFDGVRQLSEQTGIKLVDEDGSLTVPYSTTSSAGGGLQILVVALASSDSGSIAEAVTYSAGGVVLDSFAIDDEKPRVEKIRQMKNLSPDLVILAGGYDRGAVAGVVNMAQLLAFSKPKPKFGGGKLPLVFCGNHQVRPFIAGMLGELFSISYTDNIRPDGFTFNMKPAIAEVHRLFMDHVMQMAPGYARLSELTSSPIIPTPAGVERILENYVSSVEGNVVLADMGGATTDIFSNIRGGFQRTVAANTGMSYSLSNIVREAGSDRVFSHIPAVDTGTARNWILSKTLFPTVVPEDETAEVIECAAAAEGMRLAWKHHIEISYIKSRVGFTERMRRLGKCKFDEAFKTIYGDRFRISDVSVIIGAGGVMAHATPRRAAWILASGFRPKGLTTLMVDRHFQSPHMGVLSDSYPHEALKYYKEQCLAPVCVVYSPLTKTRNLTVTTPGSVTKVASGGFLYLESCNGVKIHNVSLPDVDVPLLVDCRFKDELLPMDFLEKPADFPAEPVLPSVSAPDVVFQEDTREFSLAYEGEIQVKAGDSVVPGGVLGTNRLVPPRIYFVDARGHVGYGKKEVTDEMVMQGIKVKSGDKVQTGDKVFSIAMGRGFTGYSSSMRSPVRGIVHSIVMPGMIILKEIQDYDGKPHSVNVAKLLGIKPRRITANLKVRLGEFVERTQVIAIGDTLKNIKSPDTGTVTGIDRKTGIVTIQYNLDPVEMLSPIQGTVTEVNPVMSASLKFSGLTVQGVAGFGKLRWGTLTVDSFRKGSIVLLNRKFTSDLVEQAVDAGVAGVIAPCMEGADLVGFLGEEPGVILTGSEDIPFSLILLSGVGDASLENEVLRKLKRNAGSNCVLFTTTRMRAGVERPLVLVQTQEE
ncbi:MAG: glutamate mutase L [Candidatus Fermentibacteraceae bacterium]|nr:glutamate mutase L [Candidatus Fermentibacteraceae bacterium]